MLALGEGQRRRWAGPDGGSSQSESSDWLLSCQAFFSAALRTSLTTKQARNSLSATSPTARGFNKSGRLYDPWQCSETVQSLVPCWWTLPHFHDHFCALFCDLTRASAGAWSASRLRRDRTAVELRELGEMTAEKEKKRWVQRAVSNVFFGKQRSSGFLWSCSNKWISMKLRCAVRTPTRKKEKCPIFFVMLSLRMLLLDNVK